jgi:hypothetical protein
VVRSARIAVATIALAAGAAGGATTAGGQLRAPTATVARGCGYLEYHNGDAGPIHATGLTCSRALGLVKYVLSRRLVHPARSRSVGFVVPSRPVRGFRFGYVAGSDTITAHRAAKRLSFYLCWFNVDC